MKLACNTVLFGNASLETALQQISWCHFDAVELAAIPSMSQHLRSDGDAAHLDEVRALAAQFGLEICAIEATGNLLDPAARARLVRVIEHAAALHVPVVNIGSSGSATDDATFDPVVEQIVALADRAEAVGVKLGVKAHVGAALWNGPTLLRALDQARRPAFAVNFDPSHIYRAGEDPAVTARQLAAHVVACHFRDNLGTAGKVSQPDQQVPGNGDMDLPAIMAALRAGGYHGHFTFECIGAGGYPLPRQTALAAQARGFLNRLRQEQERVP